MTRLSKNLQPIFEFEQQHGNKVLRIEEPARTKCPYAVVFKYPLHFDEIALDLPLGEAVEKWEYRDYHYCPEAGFFCKETRHAVYGPITGEYPEDTPIVK
jgi:hypothetical protein